MENKVYSEKTRKLRQNTQKIANFLRYYGKIHSKLPIFCVKSVKIYTGQKNLHRYTRGIRDKLGMDFLAKAWLQLNVTVSLTRAFQEVCQEPDDPLCTLKL